MCLVLLCGALLMSTGVLQVSAAQQQTLVSLSAALAGQQQGLMLQLAPGAAPHDASQASAQAHAQQLQQALARHTQAQHAQAPQHHTVQAHVLQQPLPVAAQHAQVCCCSAAHRVKAGMAPGLRAPAWMRQCLQSV